MRRPCPEPQLRVARCADLAHEYKIEGCPKGFADLERNRHPAPWQSEDNRIAGPQAHDGLRELTACFGAITKAQIIQGHDQASMHSRGTNQFWASATTRS